MQKRMLVSLIGGVLLGLVCVVGASVRSGFEAQADFIFSLWFNRVLMGFIIGAPWPILSLNKTLLRGALIGLFVSFAFYSSTGFDDLVSFLAGVVYGIILEAYLYKTTR